MSVGPLGLSVIDVFNDLIPFLITKNMVFDAGLIYTSSGLVVDPVSTPPTTAQNFIVPSLDQPRTLFLVRPDSSVGRVLFIATPNITNLQTRLYSFDQTTQQRVIQTVGEWARTYAVATILGTERLTAAGRQIAACVIDARGQVQGYQTKNQIDPSEDRFYVPGNTRQLFEINGVKFGVAICHEGWRYPETVRWAAVRGAKIVFHPQHSGYERAGPRLTEWGAAGNPYYEQAMMMRSRENTIYFASVNYALRFQESATSLIAPSGECQAYLPYGQEGVLVQAIDIEKATGLLAGRFAPERYQEFGGD